MTTAGRIDLNADLGEDPLALDRDAQLMAYISSCNIACGGHAGDADTMHAMIRAAKARQIATGAHPSYPDRDNFGRVSMQLGETDLRDYLIEQIETLQNIAREDAVTLTHIKPHGALYNDLADNAAMAQSVAAYLHRAFPDLALVGLAQGAFETAARGVGSRFVAEAFVDRAYLPNGRLVPRRQPGAIIATDDERLTQALQIALHGEVQMPDGVPVTLNADSLCIHSDSPGALSTARLIREGLNAHNIDVAAATA